MVGWLAGLLPACGPFKVSDSGFEDSRLDSWLARSAVYLRRGHSTAERRQHGLRWFQPVLFVIPLFVCFLPLAYTLPFTSHYGNRLPRRVNECG